jgi:hypothetical protein
VIYISDSDLLDARAAFIGMAYAVKFSMVLQKRNFDPAIRNVASGSDNLKK